jgi:alkylation response protein AidB-like acyl-CoA dehydrogenase
MNKYRPPIEGKELRLLDDASREFAQKQLAPTREENDRYPFGPFFDQTVQKAFDLDFFHILPPEEMNGMNLGIGALSIVLGNICREDAGLAGIIFTTAAAQEIMHSAGSRRELNTICASKKVRDFLIATPVFNDPSQVKHRCSVDQAGGRHFLAGRIEYVVLGGMARQALIPGQATGENKFSYYLVDLDQKGIHKSPPILSLGLHGCPAVDLQFDQVPCTLIGSQGLGEVYFENMADRLHAAAAAMAAGIMQGSFQEALDYARKREQGGHPIINWSAVRMMLAEMAVKITNAEMILSEACRSVDQQTPQWRTRSRAAALLIQAMACEATTDGIQVLGGAGYMKDFGQEKRFRDAKHIQALLGIAPLKKINFLKSTSDWF